MGTLASNAGHFTPPTTAAVEPYVALRLLATALGVLALIVVILGGLIVLLVILGSIGSAGAASRVAPGAVPVGIPGLGLLGGVLILIGAALQALFFWAGAQSMRVMLSTEGHAREAAAIQGSMLAELRRTGVAALSSSR